jgi:hypothetical protein
MGFVSDLGNDCKASDLDYVWYVSNETNVSNLGIA